MPTPKRRTTTTTKPKATTVHCHTCAAKIPIPRGWSAGPAVRRHYWQKHRGVMTKRKKELDS